MPQMIDADDDLGLADYLRIARRRWSWVLLPLAGIVALAGFFTVRQPPRYCATAQVLIADSEAQIAIQGDANVFVANRDLANEINIAYSDAVRRQVDDRLGVEPDVEIDGDTTSDILRFRACGPTAETGATHANAWAAVYVETKQAQAADNIGTAVDGFEARLVDLRTRRQELRRDVEIQLQRLATTTDEGQREALRASIDLLEADLEVEVGLIDAQIETIASTITQLEMDSELARTGTARVIQVAAPPRAPANAPLSRNLALAGVAGLIIGAVLAFGVDNLDRTIKTADDIDGIPVLGVVPRPGRRLGSAGVSLATMNHGGSPVAEAYQKVRTAVEFAILGRELTSLLITSPNQSEGKTTTSSNLAWALSAVDHRVVLTDVDFRRPRLHEVFGCRIEPGLSDHLLHGTALNRLALRVDDDHRNLVIIPTGTRPPNPADFVASTAFTGLIRKLENEADLVVLDSPPVLPVSDALSMARQVDAVIVVVKAGSTSRDELTETLEALRGVGADVLGVCLVGVRTDPSRYEYGPTPERRRRGDRPRRQRTERDRRPDRTAAEAPVPSGRRAEPAAHDGDDLDLREPSPQPITVEAAPPHRPPPSPPALPAVEPSAGERPVGQPGR